MLLRDPSPSSIAALAVCLGRPSRVLRTESLIKLLECPSLTKLSTSLHQSLYVMALSEEESLNIGRFNFFGLPPGPSPTLMPAPLVSQAMVSAFPSITISDGGVMAIGQVIPHYIIRLVSTIVYGVFRWRI